MELITKNIHKISDLCKKHEVDKLYAFGSVTSDKLSPSSDIDLLVKFNIMDLGGYFDNYMDFKESLEKLLHRPIDLLEEQAIKNPVLKRSVDRQKVLVYG